MKTVTLDARVAYGVLGIPRRSRTARPYVLEEIIQVDLPLIDAKDAPCVLNAVVRNSWGNDFAIRNEWNGSLYEPRSSAGRYRYFVPTDLDLTEELFMDQKGFISAFRFHMNELLWKDIPPVNPLTHLPLDVATVAEDRREASIERVREIVSGMIVIGEDLYEKSPMPVLALDVYRTEGGRVSLYRPGGELRPNFKFAINRLADAEAMANEYGVKIGNAPRVEFEVYPQQELLDQSNETMASAMAGLSLMQDGVEEVFADLTAEGMGAFVKLQQAIEDLRSGDRAAVYRGLDLMDDIVQSRFFLPTMPERIYSRVCRTNALTLACVRSARDWGDFCRAPAPDDDESLVGLGL